MYFAGSTHEGNTSKCPAGGDTACTCPVAGRDAHA